MKREDLLFWGGTGLIALALVGQLFTDALSVVRVALFTAVLGGAMTNKAWAIRWREHQ